MSDDRALHYHSMHEKYTYSVTWSNEDDAYVGSCAEFPHLSWLDGDPNGAMSGIMQSAKEALCCMYEDGEMPPQAFSCRAYSGKFMVRTLPQVHQRLMIEAARNHVSLNRYVNMKLST